MRINLNIVNDWPEFKNIGFTASGIGFLLPANFIKEKDYDSFV